MKKLVIHMLGEFSITYGDKTVQEQDRRTRKMWTLMQYLIAHHGRDVSQSELIELLWPNGESTNPAGALKTQLYRLRLSLNEAGLPGDEMLISVSGSYSLTGKIPCEIDSDQFEYYVKQASECFSEKEKLAFYRKAIDIYKGDFLAHCSDEQWVMPINAYFHSTYLKIVHSALDILYNFHRYQDMSDICHQALKIENLDESIHAAIIRAMAGSGDRQGAKNHYLYVLDLFYNKEGINPGQDFVSLYGEITKSENEGGAGIERIRSELAEKGPDDGAFYCEYDAFRHIYQLELRESRRTGKPVYLCVITVAGKQEQPISLKQQNRVMTQLKSAISVCVRRNDVYSRYSTSQFVLAFPGASDEICEKIMKRVLRQFKKDNPRSKALLMFSYERTDKGELV